MAEVIIDDAVLAGAAAEGMDAFTGAFIEGIRSAIGGELNAETMAQLNTSQLGLLAWDIIHTEVMDGGFVQLIHNGYGGFIFENPVARLMKQWGLKDLGKLLYNAAHEYYKCHEDIERDMTDEEFMALFEKYPQFDNLDDAFVENEEEWTAGIAHYIDEHISDFCTIRKS